MIRAPGGQRGRRADGYFEAVDLLPTAIELAFGLTVPVCPRNITAARGVWTCTDGVSAAAAVVGSGSTRMAAANSSAYSQVPRGKLVDGEPGNIAGEVFMGYTLRQPGWRCVTRFYC
jgi:hypothetical protein